MNRTAKLNLLLGVDPSEFKKAIDKAVGGEIRQVKVNVAAQLDGAGNSFGKSAAAQISKATIKADFSNFVADQLATRIAKATGNAVEEAVRKGSKGDLLGAVTGLIGKAVSIPVQAVAGTAKAALGAIAGGATATARTVFKGIIYGVTQSASAELGDGIRAGLQQAIGGTLGSPELIGRKLIENLAQGISQVAGKAADALEVDLPNVGQAVRKNLGEQEVLTDSRARSAEDREVKTQRKESAQVELNRERQETFRTQATAVESYAKITQAVERQSRELVKKNSETIRVLREKLSNLAAEASQGKNDPIAAKELQRKLTRQLNDLLAPFVELEKIQAAAKAKLEKAFAGSREARANFAIVEGGEAYRQKIIADAKVLDAQQIEIAERIQQQQQVLSKGLGIAAKITAKIKAAPDAERDSLLALQIEAQRNINAIAKDINELKATRTAILGEITGLVDRTSAIPQKPNKIIADILKEFGAQNIGADQVPRLQLATEASLKSTTNAQYLPELNVIQVRQELFEALQKATSAVDLTPAQQRLIREEVFHSLQFDLGSLQGLDALNAKKPLVNPVGIRPEEIKQAGRNLNYYAPEVRQIELEAKIAANRGTSAAAESAARTAQQQELFKQGGFGGIEATEIFNEALQSAAMSIQAVERQAKKLGIGIDSSHLNQAIATVSADLERFGSQALRVAAGEFDSLEISEINQDFKQIKVTIKSLNSAISELSSGLERQAAEVKQSGNIDGALSVIVESGRSVSTTLDQLGSKLAPAVTVVGGAINYTTKGLIAVGKAGLALADKLGFAASSLIPGGALAYGPVKEAVKFAGPAVAAGTLATQVPAAGEIIGAITSAVSAILAPATSGLSASVGHAVSAEIAGALPALFSALSRVVTESGLPGSEVTAAAVDKLGGGLIRLLEPVVSGVANAADSAIVSVGQAVNEFLGEVGGLLLAGKGIQEGVKLATNPDARSAALDAVEAVGSGVGQTINGIADGVEDIKDALGRTKRAVERNVEEIKAGTQELSQGNLRAISDIKDAAEDAASNIARGSQDVGKAIGKAGQQVKEGVGKVAKITLSGAVRLPDGLDIGELSKEGLIALAQQFKARLIKTLEAEARAASASSATGTGRSGLLKSDLNKLLGVLIDKLDGSVAAHAVELQREFGEILPELSPRLNLPQLEPVAISSENIEVKAQSIELEIPKTTYDVPSQIVDVKIEEVDLVVNPPKDKLIQFREQLSKLDEAKDTKINEIRNIYQGLKEDVAQSKSAAKKGDIIEIKKLQEAIATKRVNILKQVDDLSREAGDILQALNALGIETGANTPIRDKIAGLRQSLTKTRQGVQRQTSDIPDNEDFQSLESINTSPKSIDQFQADADAAIGRIESSLYEFGRVANKINDFVIKVSAEADVIGNIPTTTKTDDFAEPYQQFVESQKDRKKFLVLEAERQRRIAELDQLIASETARIGDEKAEQIISLKRQRANLERPVQRYQAEDLEQFSTRKIIVNPTGAERGLVAQKRLERDASERQINDMLRRGKAPTASLEENQIAANLAISSFEKNASKFESVAARIENGSTKTQKALRKTAETFSTFRQKIDENGGFSGVLEKVGQSLSSVAEKVGLPVGAIGKLGGIIKGVGIAALAYVGITQLGDALVTLGRQAFEVSTRVETLQTQLKFVGGESNLPENLAFIRKESERLKRPLDQVTEGLTQLSIATRDTALEGRTQEIASIIGTLGRVYGLSAENTKSIQYQLGQTIRLGRAQGDELRSISDAGANLQGALEKVLNKSAADVRKQLEAGQISAVAVVDALKLLANTAKAGLPEALETSAASLDDLNRKFIDVAILVGEKTKPAIVGGLGAIGTAIDIAVDAGKMVEPIFGAIGQALGLVLDLATPVVGAIAAIGAAISSDLNQGAVIPFQLIGAGLSEIRKGFAAMEQAANQALGAIASNLPTGLGEILKYANPVTIAIRALGVLIGVSLVAAIIKSSVAIVGTMIPALIGMATTLWSTVIPAIVAARGAALAFIATPLGAAIAVIALAAAAAAPHLDEMALSMSGLSKEQVAANETAIAFHSQYTKGLDQLQKGIPLTAEKLQELKDGLVQSAKEGKGTAKEAAILSANLDRLQANVQAAARLQGELADAMKKSTEAIKNQSKAIDSDYNERLAGLNESLANQQITRERFDAAELDAQQEKTTKYTELYQTQGDALRSALSRAQAQLLQPIPGATRAEVAKQIIELEAQINDIETKSSEQRIALAQNRIKATEKIENDRVKQAENAQKIIENQVASGNKAQIDGDVELSQIRQQGLRRKLELLDRQIATERDVAGELSEIGQRLYSERKVLETELTKIVAEETSKRYEHALKELDRSREALVSTIAEAEVEASLDLQKAQNAGLLKQAEVESKKTDITRDRLRKELALELANVEALQSLPSPTDPEKAEEHQKRIREGKLKTAQLTQSLAENEYKRQQEIRQAAEKAIEEQVKGVENAANALEQLGKIASNALERQNKILEAQKSLRASIVGLHDEEFKILIETETNEKKKADLQEKGAKFRLDSLRASQKIEEKILEIQLAQEKVQARVAILKAQAAVAKAEAEKAKVEANPESTAADKQAAALGLEASQIELGATVETARLQEGLAQFKRQQAQVDNRKELLGARFDYAKSIADPRDRADAIERIQASAARGLKQRNQAMKTPIFNSPQPDYSQVDSAQRQLGLIPKDAKLGRFIPPTPVDLHSGIGSQITQITNLSEELRMMTSLTQSGVVGNLIKLVEQNKTLSGQLMGLANRPQVVQHINNKTTKRMAETEFAGLPL